MKTYLRSSPYFFRLIKASFAAGIAALLLLAWFVPAPLQEAADFARVPNPARSAWFLLWMQELVSYSAAFVYPIVALAVFFALLPWLPISPPAEKASWLPADQRLINWLTLIAFAGIVALTVVAMFFRGENWSLAVPF